jgi:hypothetical protein
MRLDPRGLVEQGHDLLGAATGHASVGLAELAFDQHHLLVGDFPVAGTLSANMLASLLVDA